MLIGEFWRFTKKDLEEVAEGGEKERSWAKDGAQVSRKEKEAKESPS